MAARVVEQGAALPLLFPRHELGFIYNAKGAAVAGAGVASSGAASASRPETVAEMEDETYTPTTVPGARLPHQWLLDDEGRRVSTHDLVNLELELKCSCNKPAVTTATLRPCH